jgi:hypothetical protein
MRIKGKLRDGDTYTDFSDVGICIVNKGLRQNKTEFRGKYESCVRRTGRTDIGLELSVLY